MGTLEDVDHKSASAGSADSGGQLSREEAFLLGRGLQELAASRAGLEHDFCVLVDQFDSTDAVRWFDGIRSTAHYVAWACSIDGGAAREHVRVARALREMPRAKELLRLGRLGPGQRRGPGQGRRSRRGPQCTAWHPIS